jgi:hypothetical protein
VFSSSLEVDVVYAFREESVFSPTVEDLEVVGSSCRTMEMA